MPDWNYSVNYTGMIIAFKIINKRISELDFAEHKDLLKRFKLVFFIGIG
jgi:hypothetical protein